MVWAALAAVPLLVFVGVMAMRQGSVIIGAAVAVLGVVGCIGVLPGLSARMNVEWNDAGVSGPSQAWGPFFGLGRATIGWDEITVFAGTWSGYAFVATADGRRVYWTEQHSGFDRMFRALLRRRPDLAPPDLDPAELA
ncbi:MAG: hypothetical protein ACOYLS_00585 [Polymorphobacter sp.]